MELCHKRKQSSKTIKYLTEIRKMILTVVGVTWFGTNCPDQIRNQLLHQTVVLGK